MQQLTTTQVALFSAAIALIGGLSGALIAGIYSLRAKRSEYVHDYYKKVIDRRLFAYEQLENLIANLKTVVLDKDRKPYHVLFSDDWEEAYGLLLAVMSKGLWLSEEAFAKTRELNFLVFRLRPDPSEVVEFAKQNHPAIAKLREDLQRILVADMLDLPNVKRFLKRKKRNTNQDLQSFEIDDNRGLVAVQPLPADVSTNFVNTGNSLK